LRRSAPRRPNSARPIVVDLAGNLTSIRWFAQGWTMATSPFDAGNL
jgi:hypothetical protein